MHEPSYRSGSYINEDLGLYAGWVCHGDSFADCMPVMNAGKDIVLLFYGENFVDGSVIERLKKQGHEADRSNAGYLVHLYEEDPVNFFQLLNGYFSGVVVDLREGKIVLFNDRYRMGRVYYHQGEEDFIFSSEAKSLLKVRPELREIDHEGLGQFFAWDCVLEEKTLFKDIFLLPGGSRWTFAGGSVPEKRTYFHPNEWENRPVLGKDAFYDRLTETFANILPRYFDDLDRIAMSVSSGLDTRAILACIDVEPGQLPCHTFSGIHRETLDAIIARKIAKAWHQPHEVLRLGRDFLSRFDEFSAKTVYVTDGCLNVNGSYDIYFNELLRNIRPVRMTGKFGSEIVRSHSMLRKPFAFPEEVFHPDFKGHFDAAVEKLDENRKCHRLTFAAFKEIPWNEYGRLSMEMSKLTVRTPYMDNDLVELMYQAPPGERDTLEISLRLVDHGNPALRRIMTDRGTAGQNGYYFSNLSRLYHYYLVKSEYMYLWQIPNWLARIDSILSPLHPEKLFTGRHQLGSYRLWYRDELSDHIRSVLLDSRTKSRPYLNRSFLEKMIDTHTRGHANYTGEINKILSAELIHRQLVEDI